MYRLIKTLVSAMKVTDLMLEDIVACPSPIIKGYKFNTWRQEEGKNVYSHICISAVEHCRVL